MDIKNMSVDFVLRKDDKLKETQTYRCVTKNAPLFSNGGVTEEIAVSLGKNIFTLNRHKMIKDILNEPYFLSAKINISGLNSLNIKITEESPVFYTKDDSSYYIFNDKGVLIEIANNIEGRNLVEITGVATEELQLGNKIINNEHIIETLEIIYPYIAENKESIKFDRFDLSKLYDIKGYMLKNINRLKN